MLSDLYSDAGSFHPSMWEEERRAKQRIHFDFEDEEVDEVKIQWCAVKLYTSHLKMLYEIADVGSCV